MQAAPPPPTRTTAEKKTALLHGERFSWMVLVSLIRWPPRRSGGARWRYERCSEEEALSGRSPSLLYDRAGGRGGLLRMVIMPAPQYR